MIHALTVPRIGDLGAPLADLGSALVFERGVVIAPAPTRCRDLPDWNPDPSVDGYSDLGPLAGIVDPGWDPAWLSDPAPGAPAHLPRFIPTTAAEWDRVRRLALAAPEQAALEEPAEHGSGPEQAAPGSPEGPITTWRAVAAACNVSPRTLDRRRKEWKIEGPPFFDSPDAARRWWRKCLRGDASMDRPAPRAPRRRPRKASGATTGTSLADLRRIVHSRD